MATLREYFDTDFPHAMNVGQEVKIEGKSPKFEDAIYVRIHLDFVSNSKYISAYIPKTNYHPQICKGIIFIVPSILKDFNPVSIATNLPGENARKSDDLIFTKLVYLYSEDPISPENLSVLQNTYKTHQLNLQYRGPEFAQKRSAIERPVAFISHDSKDKELVARPLATELKKLMCPVWYDEFSLKLGDNLRQSIELGIKEAKKCIVIISKNFLSNPGWTKTEFDSIFTKELLEKKDIIIPIWVDVTQKDVYQYSPSLANKFAIKWGKNQDALIRKIHQALK